MTDSPLPLPGSVVEAAPPAVELEASLRRSTALVSDDRAGELERIIARWMARGFTVLVVGEFKRGKSTLLNALVGEELLPTGVLPVTAVPTRVRSGVRRRAAVSFLDGSEREIPAEQARDYVDEARNPGNRRRVASVDVDVESGPAAGVVLVDVPGLGSVHKHNTERALAVLPEADLALVVASVDPPIGEAEIRLLAAVREHAAHVDVVLNKVDYLDEAGRGTALEFTELVVSREGFPEARIWPVSAREGLRARLRGDDGGWRRSGMEALSAHLARSFCEERVPLLSRSLAKKAGRLLDQELALLEMQRAASERSAESLRNLIETFRSRRRTAERDSDEAILAFRRRFGQLFEGYSLRAAEAWAEPRSALESRLREILSSRERRSRRETWALMESSAREAVDAFIEAFVPVETPRFTRAYERLTAEVSEAGAERAEAVWRLAADLLAVDPPQVDAPAAPPAPTPSGFQLDPLRLLFQDLEDATAWLLPRKAAVRRYAAHARDEAEERYGRAVEQVREGFSRAYERHFRGLLAAFDACTRRTAEGIEAALAAAEARASGLAADEPATSAAATARRAAIRKERDRLAQIAEGSSPSR